MRRGRPITRSRDLRLFSRRVRNGRVVCGLSLAAGAIVGFATPAQAAVFFFTDLAAFQTASSAAGLVEDASWDFSSNLTDGASDQFEDILNTNTHALRTNAWSVPSALWNPGLDSVTFSSNTTPGAGFAPNAAGIDGMDFRAGTAGGNLLLSKTKEHSFDILLGDPVAENYPAIWVDLISLDLTNADFTVKVYDENDALMDMTTVTGGAAGQPTFLGILTDATTIGRVDIWSQTAGSDDFEGISRIAVYNQIPAPGSLALLGLAALCLTTRRHRA